MERNEVIYEPNWDDRVYKFQKNIFEEVFKSEDGRQKIFKARGGNHFEVYSFNKVPLFRGGTSQWGFYAWTVKTLERAHEILKSKNANGI